MVNTLALLAIVMCALGIGLCIYLLATKKIDTKLPSSNMLICFLDQVGGFLMQSLVHLSLGCFFGITCFFIGFSIWAYKHLKIVDNVYRTFHIQGD